jgi:cellulose synthase/poly-beta-1,6-N-acetylglucosamine synthase-like glycosyltransferase
VVHGRERPPGWVGKTWALKQGLEHSHAPWLWFVDADMGLDPRALATAWSLARQSRADLVTLAPGAVIETFWQGVIGLTLMQLLAHLYPVRHVNDPARPDAMAVGGFILVDRQAYDRAGGHESVRQEIVEDIALARRMKSGGGRLCLQGAPQLVWTHMYGSLADIWRGLRKNAFAGMDYRFYRYAFGALVALWLAWAPVVSLALGLGLSLGLGHRGPTAPAPATALVIAGAAGWLVQALASLPFARFLRVPLALTFALPLGITLYVAIATSSVWHYLRGRVLWKDVALPVTEIQSQPPRANPE